MREAVLIKVIIQWTVMLVRTFSKFCIFTIISFRTLLFIFEKQRYEPLIRLKDIEVDEVQECHLNELGCTWYRDWNQRIYCQKRHVIEKTPEILNEKRDWKVQDHCWWRNNFHATFEFGCQRRKTFIYLRRNGCILLGVEWNETYHFLGFELNFLVYCHLNSIHFCRNWYLFRIFELQLKDNIV